MLHPETMGIDAAAKRQALEAVLNSESLSRSESLRAFLRYVCEAEIAGKANTLNEYVIGVDALGRPPGYSPAEDAVVRNKAYDLRNKLRRYYDEENPAAPVRIEIPKGGYSPRFLAHCESPPPARRKSHWAWGSAAIALAFTVAAGIWYSWPDDPVQRIWRPLLASDRPVVVCYGAVRVREVIGSAKTLIDQSDRNVRGRQMITLRPSELSQIDIAVRGNELTGVGAAVGLFQVGAFLERMHKPRQLRLVEGSRFGDLAQSPTVLIGLGNNPLSMAALQDLPFTSKNSRLQDSQNPARLWGPVSIEDPIYVQDFGVATRLLGTATRQPLMILAGLQHCGTEAAVELFTDPGFAGNLAHRLPSGWEGQNVQVVVSTKVFEGACGSPEIVAFKTW